MRIKVRKKTIIAVMWILAMLLMVACKSAEYCNCG